MCILERRTLEQCTLDRWRTGPMCIMGRCVLDFPGQRTEDAVPLRMAFFSRASSAKKSRELGHLHAQISAAPRLRYGRAKFGKGWEGMIHRDPRFY